MFIVGLELCLFQFEVQHFDRVGRFVDFSYINSIYKKLYDLLVTQLLENNARKKPFTVFPHPIFQSSLLI